MVSLFYPAVWSVSLTKVLHNKLLENSSILETFALICVVWLRSQKQCTSCNTFWLLCAVHAADRSRMSDNELCEPVCVSGCFPVCPIVLFQLGPEGRQSHTWAYMCVRVCVSVMGQFDPTWSQRWPCVVSHGELCPQAWEHTTVYTLTLSCPSWLMSLHY